MAAMNAARPVLRLHVETTTETPVIDFLREVYAIQNSEIAGGSQASLDDLVTQVRNLQRYLNELLTSAQQPPRDLLLLDLTDPLVAGAMKWQTNNGNAPNTANKLRAAVVALVNFAIDVLELPLRRLRTRKFPVPKRKPRCWLPDEVLRILAAAQRMPGKIGDVPAGAWFFALELFILNTGTRISAAMNTPTVGLDLDGGWITIPAEVQKHDSDETFDLLPITIAALKAIRPQRHKRIFDDWPFDRAQRQWPTLNRWQKRIIVAAGLRPSLAEVTEKDLFHKLRRSFATFVAAKAGKQVARIMLGHSHESVTDLYLDERMTNDRPRLADLLIELQKTPVLDGQRRLFD
jgi:integrase